MRQDATREFLLQTRRWTEAKLVDLTVTLNPEGLARCQVSRAITKRPSENQATMGGLSNGQLSGETYVRQLFDANATSKRISMKKKQ